MRYTHQMMYAANGFTIKKSAIGIATFYSWDSVDTIVFDSHVSPGDGASYSQRYIVFLNYPPQRQVAPNASWRCRLLFKMWGAGQERRLHLYNTDAGFATFLPAAAQALQFPLLPAAGFEERGDLYTMHKTVNPYTGVESSQIRATTTPGNSGYILIFDRQNRLFEQIYAQHQSM